MDTIIKDGIHFIGIGGIGMSAIAEVLMQNGFKVSGSDSTTSKLTDRLQALGAKIYLGHSEKNLNGVSIVVYSSAIKPDNPEYNFAKEHGIPLLKRAEILAALIKEKKSIAVAGAHGKSTTSSMIATIFCELEKDPTYVIGGIVNNLKKNANAGKGEWLIAEADESDGTFLLYSPLYSSISNIDIEHMDHYKTKENIFDSFIKFGNSVPFYGLVFLNKDDNLTMKYVADNIERKKIYTSTKDKNADYFADEIHFKDRASYFKLFKEGLLVGDVKLNILGKHNVYNALQAIAISDRSGLEMSKVILALENFQGVERRMQTIYKNELSEFIEDYAHHPTEINAVCSTFESFLEQEEFNIIFEPHRYSRFRDLWSGFIDCFKHLKCNLYVLPVYSAGEEDGIEVNSQKFIKELKDTNKQSSVCAISYEELPNIYEQFRSRPCKVLILGAGKVGKVSKKILSDIDEKNCRE